MVLCLEEYVGPRLRGDDEKKHSSESLGNPPSLQLGKLDVSVIL